jgi:hypothetical protein
MTHQDRCRSAAASLADSPSLSETDILIGFDGFADSIVDIVKIRHSADRYDRIETIAAYAERLARVAGKSTNLERVVKQVKLGGNGPIMANAVLGHDLRLTYIGILGGEVVEPVFQSMVDRAYEVINLGPACATDAYEFDDGKVMMTLSQPLGMVTWDYLVDQVGHQRLQECFRRARAIATVNWTQTLMMTDIWERITTEVMPGLREDRPIWFVDLADPAKRTPEDLQRALRVLGQMEERADVMLGMNEEEARQVLVALGGEWPESAPALERAETAAAEVRRLAGISTAVVHFTAEAACATVEGSWASDGFYTAKPVITTGAGDHFNAGFLSAWLGGLRGVDSLIVGTATSGFYVRNAATPTREDLVAFLQEQAATPQ